MTNIVFVLASAVTLFTVGILIGLGLHIQGIDRKYREVAQLVRGLNDRQDAIRKGAYSREVREECPLERHELAPLPLNENGAGQPAEVPRPRMYDPQRV
ncbi:MAG: hypothetical protein M3Q75_03265 [Gemmatimonadota bacterium]|jgi:hypothetical protein|nr:hypothetical protein [Gemmatimonadota bacterium]